MSEVHVRENESLESALKRFKRSCAKSGVLAEVRKREHYELSLILISGTVNIKWRLWSGSHNHFTMRSSAEQKSRH